MKGWTTKGKEAICLRFDKGEEVWSGIQQAARDYGLTAGSITGIGALEEIELAYYDVETNEYERVQLTESYELLSLTGNLTFKDGEPFPHLHAVLSDRDCACRGGHFFRGIVSVTVEVYVTPFPVSIVRELDPVAGVPTMR